MLVRHISGPAARMPGWPRKAGDLARIPAGAEGADATLRSRGAARGPGHGGASRPCGHASRAEAAPAPPAPWAASHSSAGVGRRPSSAPCPRSQMAVSDRARRIGVGNPPGAARTCRPRTSPGRAAGSENRTSGWRRRTSPRSAMKSSAADVVGAAGRGPGRQRTERRGQVGGARGVSSCPICLRKPMTSAIRAAPAAGSAGGPRPASGTEVPVPRGRESRCASRGQAPRAGPTAGQHLPAPTPRASGRAGIRR
jgi:hypothetical protein